MCVSVLHDWCVYVCECATWLVCVCVCVCVCNALYLLWIIEPVVSHTFPLPSIFSCSAAAWGSSDRVSNLAKNILMILKVLSLTGFSLSTVTTHNAGKILPDRSELEIYMWVAAMASTAAIRAGGNGSFNARRNAVTRTFCLVYNTHTHTYTIHLDTTRFCCEMAGYRY